MHWLKSVCIFSDWKYMYDRKVQVKVQTNWLLDELLCVSHKTPRSFESIAWIVFFHWLCVDLLHISLSDS